MAQDVYLITGAFGALGRSVASRLAAQGGRLALVDAAPTVPPEIASVHANHLLLAGVDLSREDGAQTAVRAVGQHFGTLSAVVNVAGGFRWETVADGSTDTWDLLYAMNVKTALHMCRAALPMLKQAAPARIINIGAAAASKAALGMGAYAASKAGVLRLTEALAEELKDSGVTVNAILPTIIDTPANRKDMPDADFSRWVKPESIAELVAFLVSPAAQDITGAALPVNGRV